MLTEAGSISMLTNIHICSVRHGVARCKYEYSLAIFRRLTFGYVTVLKCVLKLIDVIRLFHAKVWSMHRNSGQLAHRQEQAVMSNNVVLINIIMYYMNTRTARTIVIMSEENITDLSLSLFHNLTILTRAAFSYQ